MYKTFYGHNRLLVSKRPGLLYRDVAVKVRVQHKLFDREEFLREHQDDEKFYRSVFKTDMFKIFLEERMLEKSDYWSELMMKTGGYSKSPSGNMFVS